MSHGSLYIVSTPIGNLEDLSLRASRILGEVETVLAEDTRRTRILLNHLGLKTPMISLHQHNEREREGMVLQRLEGGASLALVSDAGTPLVSDPGERLVAAVREAGFAVIPIPGPSAVLAALAASGLPAVPFTFLGFLPRKGEERSRVLERIRGAPETVVLFESPERLTKTLEALAEGGEGHRRAVVARELTKIHEEHRGGTLEELRTHYTAHPPRGEITLVLAPSGGDPADAALSAADSGAVDEQAVRSLALALLREGSTPSGAAKEVARRLRLPRNQVYRIVQTLEGSEPE
jgi:16S rRNA (cytidine1402-2'-O)-methyltransferase